MLIVIAILLFGILAELVTHNFKTDWRRERDEIIKKHTQQTRQTGPIQTFPRRARL